MALTKLQQYAFEHLECNMNDASPYQLSTVPNQIRQELNWMNKIADRKDTDAEQYSDKVFKELRELQNRIIDATGQLTVAVENHNKNLQEAKRWIAAIKESIED